MPRTQKEKLTVGLLLDTTFDSNDGVQQYVKLLGGWLSGRGHTIHYIVGHSSQQAANIHSMTRLVSVRFNGNTIKTPLPAKKSTIATLLRKVPFDVLHVQTPHSPLMAHKVIISPHHAAAVVGTFHIMPYSVLEKWSIRLLGLLLKKSVRRLHSLMAVSRPAAELVQYAYGQPAAVIPNAVDVSHFRAPSEKRLLPKNKTNIVFLGRLVERKGCMHLLRALSVLERQQKLENVQVTICSDGAQRQALEKYVADNNLCRTVIFKGFIDEADKPVYLRGADVAVFPSTSGESFGIVLIEAMAAGSSVVLAGDNPGYRSVMEGFEDQLIDPRDTEAFAGLLLKFITDKKARSAAKARQQQAVKRFDINTVGTAIETVYYEAIAKKQKLQDNT